MSADNKKYFEPDEEIVNDNSVRRLIDNAVQADFPENDLPRDDKGLPQVSILDERLTWQPRNDIGNAQRLIQRYGADLMYVDRMGWYVWTGTHWDGEMGDLLAEKKCHMTVQDMKRERLALAMRGRMPGETDAAYEDRLVTFRKFINTCGNASRLSAMLQVARPYLAKLPEELDTHPMLVTVDNGTLDLRGRETDEGRFEIPLLPHDKKHLITKKMNVVYDRDAGCDKFKAALNDIVPDPAIQNFLQRWFGYCLTGLTKEQAVLMMWGGGSNGKSLLMDTISYIFDGYAKGIPIDSIMAKDKSYGGSGATPDIAILPGARWVTASEPETGQRFSEKILKTVSGEEKLQARNLNEKFFFFYPQFKLCISFNNKPSVKSSDDGFWRRVLLVPFEQKFWEPDDPLRPEGGKVKNKALRDELRAEASGILNWMLDGYLMWKESGLQVPDKIRAAVDEYRSEANPLLQFFRAWCDRGTTYSIAAADLYDAYVLWAKTNGLDVYSRNLFGRKISDDTTIRRTQAKDKFYYFGIALNEEGLAAVSGTAGNPLAEEEHDITV